MEWTASDIAGFLKTVIPPDEEAQIKAEQAGGGVCFVDGLFYDEALALAMDDEFGCPELVAAVKRHRHSDTAA